MNSEGANDQTGTGPSPVSPSLVLSNAAAEPEAPWDDDALLRGLLAGDRRAAGALYDHLFPAIERTLRRILHARGPDFEDLVQSTFERVLRNLAAERFDGRSSLKTWASAIASHVALDALRKISRDRPRNDELPSDDVLAAGTQPERRLESAQELRRVQGILSSMKPRLSETLILYDVLGYKMSEIAQLHGASENATQSRLHRARKEFRRRFERTIPRRKS